MKRASHRLIACALALAASLPTHAAPLGLLQAYEAARQHDPQLPVELIFSAFNQNTTPRVPGVVTQVSPDRLDDPKTGVPYYRLRAEITPEGGSTARRSWGRPAGRARPG